MTKENAHDYRYFPEPDLVPVALSDEQIDAWRRLLPEKPEARRARMIADYGIAEYDAGVLSQHKANADFFEAAAQGLDRKTAKLLCNLFMGDALALLNASGKEIGACALTPDALRALVVLSAKGTINGPTVKDLLPELFEKGGVLSDDAPPVNEVAERYVEKGTEETGAVNTVAGMILDYRAFDTLGESFVLFTAMCAVTMLMNAPGKRRVRKLDYEVLDYYLEMIRNLHKRTYDYLGNMKASTNPLAYCEGGFYGGHLKPQDKIKPLLKPMTASFGITALNELQELYNGKSIREDGEFALEVMRYINKKINEYKEEDGILYAIYGTPAESLCGLQIEQFRKKYGIVENVSDRPYVSNSFHCHVSEDITPIQKQDLENRFWNLSNGGKIQYVKYPIGYNTLAIKSLIRRAMDMGFYEGVNLSLSYCDDCGHEELQMDVCPKCGSKNLTKIDRMNGYLSYSRVHGDTRLNAAKMAEIADRKSM